MKQEEIQKLSNVQRINDNIFYSNIEIDFEREDKIRTDFILRKLIQVGDNRNNEKVKPVSIIRKEILRTKRPIRV